MPIPARLPLLSLIPPFNDYEIQLHFYRKACYSVEVQEPAAQGSLNRISQKEAQKHYARL